MKLIVELVNTFRTRLAVHHENDHIPFRRRIVCIELTPDQIKKLEPKKLGTDQGADVFEELGNIWVQDDL